MLMPLISIKKFQPSRSTVDIEVMCVHFVFRNNLPWKLLDQVRRSAGRLDVPFRWRALSSGEAANLLHQLREVPVGGEHQPHEEAGLSRHTEENDHHQV